MTEGDVLESYNTGLGPGYRRRIQNGNKITFVMDSGAIKTIVTPDAIPGMKVKKTKNTGKTFRVANGAQIPNLGETIIHGQSENDTKMKITAQVAAITKPLASANELVDADNIILLHKHGGIVKQLTVEQLKRVIAGINQLDGAEIPIGRSKGQFQIDVNVPDQVGQSGTWQAPKKTGKQDKSDKMEVDFVGKNQFSPLSTDESAVEGFQRLFEDK